MLVGIGESGVNRAPTQIHDICVATPVGGGPVVVAHVDDTIATHHHGFCRPLIIVGSVDAGIMDHQIRWHAILAVAVGDSRG